MEVTDACRLAELNVPQDVAVLGVDNDELLCEFAFPPLSSVCLPSERLGCEAAALLDALIAGARPPKAPLLLLPTDVAARTSTDILLTEDPDIAAAIQFLRAHAHQGIGIPDVLRHVTVSRRRLERAFREFLGLTPLEELHLARLARARQPLAQTDQSITQIAAACGYPNSSRLAVVFKKFTGQSARAYRRQMARRA
jgi:LacI family transcriptional regulator